MGRLVCTLNDLTATRVDYERTKEQRTRAKILSFPPLPHSTIAAVKEDGRQIDRTIRGEIIYLWQFAFRKF